MKGKHDHIFVQQIRFNKRDKMEQRTRIGYSQSIFLLCCGRQQTLRRSEYIAMESSLSIQMNTERRNSVDLLTLCMHKVTLVE